MFNYVKKYTLFYYNLGKRMTQTSVEGSVYQYNIIPLASGLWEDPCHCTVDFQRAAIEDLGEASSHLEPSTTFYQRLHTHTD